MTCKSDTIEMQDSKFKKWTACFMIILGTINILYFFFGLLLGWGLYFGMTFMLLVGLLLFPLGVYRLKAKSNVTSTRFNVIKRFAKLTVIAAIVSFVIVESFIIHSAVTEEKIKADFLIILGAALVGDQPTLDLKKRLDKGIEYLQQYPDTKVIVSGGQGQDEQMSEAEAMKRYLIKKGINSQNIILEDRSSNTLENIQFSRDILNKLESSQNSKVMIVSNDFHIFRAKLLAKRLNLNAYGLPAETPLYIIPNHYVREFFAVVKCIIVGMV
ncbi:MAG: YdcF family protein [Clostridia bacterium]|nr:YdcF family protein [Clostridia bacterium]